MKTARRPAALPALVVGGAVLASTLALVPASAATPDTPVDPGIAAIIGTPQYANASWGWIETDAVGRVYTARNADQMFIPGSNIKLFTVTSTWDRWGAATRFVTPVHAVGRRSGATLTGVLSLVGSGDLSLGGRVTKDGRIAWTNFDHTDANAVPGLATLTPQDPLAGLNSLARQVRASGITRVRGDVVIDDRLFSADFEPQPTPVMINDNLLDVVVVPTRPGSRARVTWRPRSAAAAVVSRVVTVPRGGRTQVQVSGTVPGTVTVEGTIAVGSAPLVQTADVVDPAGFARTLFIEALRRNGVAVDARATGPNPANRIPRYASYSSRNRAAVYVSPPYREFATLIMKVSHNLGANLGICLLALRARSHDCAAGFGPAAAALRARGVDLGQIVLADGRGGDPADRATPVATAQLLRSWLPRADFDRFRATLPVLGVDGSLLGVAADTPAKGKVFAKTGTTANGDYLNERLALAAKALGGFYRAEDGSWRVFQVVVNDAGGGGIDVVLAANQDVGRVAARMWELSN